MHKSSLYLIPFGFNCNFGAFCIKIGILPEKVPDNTLFFGIFIIFDVVRVVGSKIHYMDMFNPLCQYFPTLKIAQIHISGLKTAVEVQSTHN